MRQVNSRKLLHVGGFTLATVLQVWIGIEAVVVLAAIFLIGTLFALRGGPDHMLYKVLSRAGRRDESIASTITPIFATVIGALITNLFFSKYAVIGYMATGWGDAAGEYVGYRWGNRRYAVSWLGCFQSMKSLEGNTAVLIFSSIGAVVTLLVLGFPPNVSVAGGGLAGIAAMITEALTPSHLDNLTTQVSAAFVVTWLIQSHPG